LRRARFHCGGHRGPHTPGVLSFLAELLLDPSGVVDEVRDWRRERRNRQRARATQIPCALRVVDGAHPGLSRRWTRGAARVPPGFLVFEPDSLWRLRVRIPVRSATLQPPGDIPRRSPRAIGAQSRRIVLETPPGDPGVLGARGAVGAVDGCDPSQRARCAPANRVSRPRARDVARYPLDVIRPPCGSSRPLPLDARCSARRAPAWAPRVSRTRSPSLAVPGAR
jgi:hypothetical protein